MPVHLTLESALGGLCGALLFFPPPAGAMEGDDLPDSALAALAVPALALPADDAPLPPEIAPGRTAAPESLEISAGDTLQLASSSVKAHAGWGLLSRSDEATGTYRLSALDMKRSVSNFDDPSRIVQTLPGVGRGNDWETALIVRGGGPDQTGYLLDGIPVYKVSHYEGMQHNHGGVGMLNMAFADGLDFHNGAFAAHLPDRMSGIVEVHYRDGDTAATQAKLITDVIGAGAAVEGPLPLEGRNGSYAGVFRYSTMDLLIRSGLLEAFGTPRYYNGQARVYLPAGNSAFRINVVGGGERWFNGIGNEAVLDLNGGMVAGGASWEMKENGGWSRADLSIQRRAESEDFRNLEKRSTPGTDSLSRLDAGSEDRYRVSADQSLSLGGRWKLQAGAAGNLIVGRYHAEHGDEETYLPQRDTTVNFDQSVHLFPKPFLEGAGYAEATWRSESEAWEVYAGYRHFYEGFSGLHGFGPRLGLKFRVTPRQALKAAFGLHTQPHDYMELSQRPDPARAKLPYTAQAVVGWESYLPAGLLVSVEVFDKEAYRLARRRMDLEDGGLSPIYLDTGRARGQGGELYLRKPRGGRLSFTAAYNYLRHRERGAAGTWGPSEYSVPHSFNAFAEVMLAKGVYLGGRYSIASGLPYIPYDTAASNRAGTGVYDLSRAYRVREPVFSRIDARLEWDLVLSGLSVCAYAEVENLLDRKNYFARSWNTLEGGEIALQGMGRIPSAGIAMNF